jgi:hypothetical protein
VTVGDEEWKERVRAYNRRQRMLRGVCECGAYYPEEHTARREGVIEGLERALRFVAPFVLQEHSDRIRAEIERLREEKP